MKRPVNSDLKTTSGSAVFSGNWKGVQLNVESIKSGALKPNDIIEGEGIVPGTSVVSIIRGSGGVGVYTLSADQPVESKLELVGFTERACREALIATNNHLMQAVDWLFQNGHLYKDGDGSLQTDNYNVQFNNKDHIQFIWVDRCIGN